MKTKTLLAALLVAFLLAAVGAQPPSSDKKPASPPTDKKPAPPPAPKPDPKIEQLVEQLGDADFRKRDEAVERLKAEGVKALPTLRAAVKHPDPEVRRRLVELIPAIETAAILAPKRISLSLKDKTITEILAEMNKQTGYQFEHWNNQPETRYSIAFKDATFWQAMDQLNKTTGMELQQNWGDDHVRLQPHGSGGASSAYTYTDGSFRFQATGFQLYKHVDLSQSGRGTVNRSETLTFMFSIQSEPRLPILGVGEVRLTAAFDSEKNSMLLPSNPNDPNQWEGRHGRYISRYGNGNRGWYQQSQLQLNRVSEKAGTLKVLRGSLPVTLLSEQVPHVLAENILKGKGKKETIGTTTVMVEDVTTVPNSPQINVKLTFNEDTGGNPNDYSWQNSIYQRIEVQDAKGNKYQIVGTQWGNSNGTSMQMTLSFSPMNPAQKVEGDVKLIFQEWKVLQHSVNFEFKDLPLP